MTLASFWSPDWVENVEIVPILLWVLVPIPVFVGSLILRRRVRGTPTLLILIGAIAYLLWRAIDLFLELIMPFVVSQPDSPQVQSFFHTVWPTCTPHWLFDAAMRILRVVSLCFPCGFVWFALRSGRRAPNQALEPTGEPLRGKDEG